MASFLFLSVIVAALAYFCYRHLDLLIVCMPQYVDAYVVRALFPRNKKNAGTNKIPFVSRVEATELENGDLKSILNTNGYPVHVKNLMDLDQDTLVDIMSRGNKGRTMRMLDFRNRNVPHFSPSCATWKDFKMVSFDDFAENHLRSDKASNHSSFYAGFESITDPSTIQEITGLDVTTLGDYRQNNLFASNFAEETLSAGLHCAPIDSFTLQLVGTKTWYFVSPENLAEYPSIPMPTFFNLPMTDDELLSKIHVLHVVKQGPGDALYFGPNWCHAVATTPGPNLMMNMRYNAGPKLKQGPLSLFLKIMIRAMTRTIGGLPQDNTSNYPLIYADLNGYYEDCGPSEAFNKVFDFVKNLKH